MYILHNNIIIPPALTPFESGCEDEQSIALGIGTQVYCRVSAESHVAT